MCIEELYNLHPSLNVHKVKDDEIVGACSIYVVQERCMQGFGGKT